METIDTFAQPFEVNVYDSDESQIWVPCSNTLMVKQLITSSFLLVGRVMAVVVEPHLECSEVENPHILPPIGTIGYLVDGVTVISVISHVEDVSPFE